MGNDGAALPKSPPIEGIPEPVRRPRVSHVAPELQLADMPVAIEREYPRSIRGRGRGPAPAPGHPDNR